MPEPLFDDLPEKYQSISYKAFTHSASISLEGLGGCVRPLWVEDVCVWGGFSLYIYICVSVCVCVCVEVPVRMYGCMRACVCVWVATQIVNCARATHIKVVSHPNPYSHYRSTLANPTHSNQQSRKTGTASGRSTRRGTVTTMTGRMAAAVAPALARAKTPMPPRMRGEGPCRVVVVVYDSWCFACGVGDE
jgi:hypothetical protein